MRRNRLHHRVIQSLLALHPDEFAAAVAVPQLKKVPAYLVEYRKSKAILDEAIAGCAWLDPRPALPGNTVAPYFWSCLFHGERKGIAYNDFKFNVTQFAKDATIDGTHFPGFAGGLPIQGKWLIRACIPIVQQGSI